MSSRLSHTCRFLDVCMGSSMSRYYPEHVMAAKLELFANAADVDIFTKQNILKSLVSICIECTVTPDELVYYSKLLISEFKNSTSMHWCICGVFINYSTSWMVHNCRFEHWLVYCKIGERQGNVLYIKESVDWAVVLLNLTMDIERCNFKYDSLSSMKLLPKIT